MSKLSQGQLALIAALALASPPVQRLTANKGQRHADREEREARARFKARENMSEIERWNHNVELKKRSKGK